MFCLLGGPAWSQATSTALTQEAERSKVGRIGLELIGREAGGREFLAACSKSAVSDAAAFTDFGVVSGLSSDVIGGHCSCVAGMLFASPQSPVYGRMQPVVRLAAAVPTGSVLLAAAEDAKSRGGETQAAIALGFLGFALDTCKDVHLDIKAREAAERAAALEKTRKTLVDQQQVTESYLAEVEAVAVRHSDATIVGCSVSDDWPNASEVMFIIDQARGEGDWFTGWLTQPGFDTFLSNTTKQPDEALINALPALRQASAEAKEEITEFSEPVVLGREGDFYRMAQMVNGKKTGYFCIARTETGRSYIAGYPPGGKALAKVDSLLSALSGSEAMASAECTAHHEIRFREDSGSIPLDDCKVLARGADAEAAIRSALIQSRKRYLAAPALVEQVLESRAAEKEAARRF
jgi:hypothetical protein